MQRSDIEFMFWHFQDQAYDFPRRIATLRSSAGGRVKSGGQFPVSSIEDILRNYAKAENKECRLGGYPYDPTDTLQQAPTLLFIDVDTLDEAVLKKVLRRMRQYLIISHPTVLNSGRGFHIIQPLDTKDFFRSNPTPKWFADGEKKGWYGFRNGVVNEFLKWAEEFLSGKTADVSHTPTIKSFLLRPPGGINAKCGKEVVVVQSWNSKKPPINLLLGEFYSAKLKQYNEQMKKAQNIRTVSLDQLRAAGNYYDTYIPIILETPLPDWREHVVSLILVPYLATVKNLPDEQVYKIAEDWLQRCNDEQSPLRFEPDNIWQKIRYTRTRKLAPMGKPRLLSEMLEKSPDAYHILEPKMNLRTNYPIAKEVTK